MNLTVVRVRLFSDMVMTKIDWEASRRMYTVGALNTTTYGRVKPATAGPVADTHF